VPTLGDWLDLFDYVNSLTQWHLPSIDELQAMYDNLAAVSLGGFADDLYWTSTEESAGGAYAIHMGSNFYGGYDKSVIYRVRASKSFTAASGAYAIGDTGPDGGIVYYVDGTTYYECASEDQSAGIAWSNIVDTEALSYGTAIGTGAGNTTLIVNQAGHTTSAASACRALTGESLATAGGKLKAIGTDYWASPNTGAVDRVGFAAKSTGELLNNTIFADLYQNGNFWTSEESDADFPPTKAVAIQMSYQYGSVTLLDLLKTTFTGVRLIKNAIPSSIIRIGFIGGNNPVAGVYRSTNGGLAWQISDTFSVDSTQLTDWIPFACSGDWWAGRGYQYEAIVYKYSESKKYTFNGTSGGVTALYVGDVIIAATEGPGSAVAKLYQYDPGLDSFVLLSSTGMSDGNISALSFSGTYLIVISTSGIYAIGHPTTVLRQAGNFTAMLDMGDGTIFAGADGGHVWRSDDYGLTWSDMGAKTPDGILSIALIGSGRIAFFSYYDIYITDDEFATVTKVYDNSITYGPIIKISETECMAFNGVDGILRAALKSTDNGETFTAIAIDDLNDFQGVITCAQISS
jgi:hypothetical protein